MPQQSLNHPQSYASVGEGRGVTKDVSCCDSVNVGAPGGMSKTGFKKKKKKKSGLRGTQINPETQMLSPGFRMDGRLAAPMRSPFLEGRVLSRLTRTSPRGSSQQPRSPGSNAGGRRFLPRQPPREGSDWPSVSHMTASSPITVARATSTARAGFEAWGKEHSYTSLR